jgi:hypothetical protein
MSEESPDKDLPLPLLIIRGYGPKNSRFSNAEGFVKAYTKDKGGESKQKPGRVDTVDFQGLKAKRFTVSSITFFPPKSIEPKEIPMKETYVAWNVKAGGFWVLGLSAPTAIYSNHTPAFDRLLKSFKPEPLTPPDPAKK